MSSLLPAARAFPAGDHPARGARTGPDRRMRPTGSTEPVPVSCPAEVCCAPRIHQPGIQGLGA